MVATLAATPGSSLAPAEAQGAQRRVEGTLTNTDGVPLGSHQIGLVGLGASQGQTGQSATAADGTFAIEVPDGTYGLYLKTARDNDCTLAGYDNPESGWNALIAVNGQSITGLEVTVSGTPGTAPVFIPCTFPDEALGHIQGIVTDAEGDPVERVWITANVHGDSGGVYEGVWTASDGAFHLRLRHGVYLLHIHSERSDECTVSGYEGPGARGLAFFDTSDGDVAGLHVTVSGATSPSPVWAICQFDAPLPRIGGTVRGPDGEPLDGINVHAFGEPTEPSFGPWMGSTNSAGDYEVEVPNGAYVLVFSVVLPEGECRVGYTGSGGSHSLIFPFDKRIIITGEDQPGFDIQLPATASELCRPISGRVTDAAGNPLSVSIAADGLGPLRGTRANTTSDADGGFTLYGQAGWYYLLVATTAGSECTAGTGPGGAPGQWARIEVGANGADDIHVVVSGEANGDRRSFYCSHPPRTVTTALQPGWNLTAWTERAAAIEALFDEIPGLDIAHVWDAGEQRFRSAFDSGSQVLGDLGTLTPGMGLWLYVGGTEPVRWTRAFRSESGFVTLAGGWNLIAWSGRDGASGEEAFAALGGQLVEAAAWNAQRDQFLHYPAPNSASGNALQQLNRGEALWLRTSEGRHWLQPGSAQPPITYAQGVSEATKAAFPPAAEAVLASFAEQYGVFVPTISFWIDNSIEYCGFYQGRAVYLREVCLRAVAHEYVHAIQAHLNESGRNPAWITEGMANRWSALYYDSTGDRTYEDHIQDVTIPNARLSPVSLEQLEETLAVEEFFHPNYSVAHLAVDWLVQLNGEDRFLEYYRNRSAHDTWEEAFLATFGIAVEDYYESFEEHRKEIAPPTATLRIEGTVMGADGQPLEGLAVRAFGSNADADTFGPWTDSSTSAEGKFSIHVPPDGSYLLQIFLALESAECVIGYYGADAQRGAFHTLTRIAITDADATGIAISISAPTSELCRRIEGAVTTADGTPVGSTSLAAYGTGASADERPTGATAQDGAFTLYGRDGTYHLGLYTSVGRECTVSGNGTGESGGDAIITVDGGDLTGLRIVVSGGPTSSPELLRCTFAE
ncbi:MAG: carboxypeptidase-like regulatory domain-containing protein [Chloroflexota bacterium]|nr:carboxypeptidase-like regulatory domain-containing protein [Chloroflexota bacterium]